MGDGAGLKPGATVAAMSSSPQLPAGGDTGTPAAAIFELRFSSFDFPVSNFVRGAAMPDNFQQIAMWWGPGILLLMAFGILQCCRSQASE